MKFDELNVMRAVDAMYSEVGVDCRTEFRALYMARYSEIWYWLKGDYPDEDMLAELVDMYLAGLWNFPNETTHYAFTPELVRKRDKAKEAIESVPTKIQKQIELEKAGRYVTQQVGFYVDIVSQDAEKKALVDAGVKKVKWNTYGDDKVCQTCFERDGTVYAIDKVPPRPHVRCRCYLTPA